MTYTIPDKRHMNKVQRAVSILMDNRGKWMSASDIAKLFPMRQCSARDVAGLLKDDASLPIERKNISTNKNCSIRYRYMEEKK